MVTDYCWVMAGSTRKRVLLAFQGEMLPSQIVKGTNLRFSSVSRCLLHMRLKEIVYVASKNKNHRLFALTEKGLSIKRKIEWQQFENKMGICN